MMRVLVCIAIALTLKGTFAQSECEKMFTGLSPEEDGHLFTIPETCQDGAVSWMEPQGDLILELEREQPFTFCMTQTFFAGTISMITVTSDEGVNSLPVPSQFLPLSCVRTAGEEMTITLKSWTVPSQYFDYFLYTVTNDPVASDPVSIDIDK